MLSKTRQSVQQGQFPVQSGVSPVLALPFGRRQFLAALPLLVLGGCGSGSSEDASTGSTTGSQKAAAPSVVTYGPNHAAIDYSDGFAVERSSTAGRFRRPVVDAWGMESVSPGSRIRFLSNSSRVVVKLRYNALLPLPNIYNGVGCVLVDGSLYSTFEQAFGYSGVLDVPLDFLAVGERLIEIVLPYAACLELAAVQLDAGSSLRGAPARPGIRCGFYGDSITQGFNASQVDQSWPYLLAASQNWQMLNAGYAGYPCMPTHGAVFAQTPVDLGIYTIGFNDFLTQVPLESFRANLIQWIRGYRSLLPTVKLYCVTPTYSPVSRPVALEAYRQVMRDVLSTLDDPHNLLVEGESLSDHGRAAFPDDIHPSGAASAQIAAALAAIVRL